MIKAKPAAKPETAKRNTITNSVIGPFSNGCCQQFDAHPITLTNSSRLASKSRFSICIIANKKYQTTSIKTTGSTNAREDSGLKTQAIRPTIRRGTNVRQFQSPLVDGRQRSPSGLRYCWAIRCLVFLEFALPGSFLRAGYPRPDDEALWRGGERQGFNPITVAPYSNGAPSSSPCNTQSGNGQYRTAGHFQSDPGLVHRDTCLSFP